MVLVVLLALAAAGCSTELPQNSLNPAGPEARKIDDLFWLVFWIAAVIFVLVEGALIYATLRFRRKRNEEREVQQVHGNIRLEIIWTIIPVVILAAIAVPTVATIFDLRRAPEPGENALIVNVIGHQWWWEFEYPEYGIETANEMHIPVDRTVYLNITSADVIHSFWVPQLNGKRDAVPSRVNHLTLDRRRTGRVPRPVRRVLRTGPRRHAPQGVRPRPRPTSMPGWPPSRHLPRSPPRAWPPQGWETFQVVCTACHNVDGASTPVSREVVAMEGGEEFVFDAALAPNLTHFGEPDHLRRGDVRVDRGAPARVARAIRPTSSRCGPTRTTSPTGRILGMPNFDLTETADRRIDRPPGGMEVTTLDRRNRTSPATSRGIWSWVTTTDHKRIGILYMFTAIFFFLVGGLEALVIRSPVGRCPTARSSRPTPTTSCSPCTPPRWCSWS